MKIVRIEPSHSHGCAPACIAMILGWKYEDVTKWFANDFNRDGIHHEEAISFLADYGYDAITRELVYYNHIGTHRAMMLEPFAPIHFISTMPYTDSKDGHAIIMDGKGKIYDPHDEPWAIEKFYHIKKVTGLWKTGGTK